MTKQSFIIFRKFPHETFNGSSGEYICNNVFWNFKCRIMEILALMSIINVR